MIRIMKNLVLFIAILSYSLIGQARTLKVECSNDSITIAIDSIILTKTNAHDFIGLQIDEISITENPKLTESKVHIVKINGIEVVNMPLKESNSRKKDSFTTKKSFTIKDDNTLSVYRDSELIGDIVFKKPIDQLYIKENIKLEPIHSESNEAFLIHSKIDTIFFKLNNPQKLHIENFYIIDNDDNIIGSLQYGLNEDNVTIGIPINMQETKNTIAAHIGITSPLYENDRISISDDINIIFKKNGNISTHWIIITFVVAFLGICLYIIKYLIKQRKNKITGAEISDEDHSIGTNGASTDEDSQNREERNRAIGMEVNNHNLAQNDQTKDAEQILILGNRISELVSQIEGLENRLCSKEQELSNVKTVYLQTNNNLNKQIAELQDTLKSLLYLKDENERITKQRDDLLKLRDTVIEVKEKNRKCVVEIQKMKDTAKDKDKQIQTLSVKFESAERSKASKDKQIKDLNAEKDHLNQYLKEEKQTSEDLRQQMGGFSKQTHYLYLIDEALGNIEKMLPVAFGNVTDETLRRKLVDPIVIGTPGLDESGMESYKEMWRAEVYDNQVEFFGKNVLQLTDGEVMEQLREKFIENLALRDSFNKLVRLYLFSNVGWLNVKLVEAGFDVDSIQTLFIELKNLFNRFGVEIAYPHLFIDAFDENKHRDSHRCDIFSIFAPNSEIDAMIHTKEGECLIVDLVRIGLPKSKTTTRRVPMVSLPNF